jgi:hypothetical protein
VREGDIACGGACSGCGFVYSIIVNGLRLSLAGYQDKAAVSIVSDAIGIPSHGATTHILKPDLKRSPGVIYCEYLCMKVAARLDLNVAVVDLRKAEDQAFLLVKRYDRISKNDSSYLERVHQEDFCQAMAIPSKKKYQDEGGPTLKACFERAYQWKTLCEDIGFSYRGFRNSAKRLCQTLPEEADAVYSEMKVSGWSHPKCEDALNIIRKNCVEMQSRLDSKLPGQATFSASSF